jgi:CRP-like cAMP-binding protein
VRNGQEVTTFGPGDFFGETALLINVPRTATVTALTDMTIMVFERREFSSLLEQSPQIGRKLLTALAERDAFGDSTAGPLA